MSAISLMIAVGSGFIVVVLITIDDTLRDISRSLMQIAALLKEKK